MNTNSATFKSEYDASLEPIKITIQKKRRQFNLFILHFIFEAIVESKFVHPEKETQIQNGLIRCKYRSIWIQHHSECVDIHINQDISFHILLHKSEKNSHKK